MNLFHILFLGKGKESFPLTKQAAKDILAILGLTKERWRRETISYTITADFRSSVPNAWLQGDRNIMMGHIHSRTLVERNPCNPYWQHHAYKTERQAHPKVTEACNDFSAFQWTEFFSKIWRDINGSATVGGDRCSSLCTAPDPTHSQCKPRCNCGWRQMQLGLHCSGPEAQSGCLYAKCTCEF
jgi:hypothetical protein